MGKRTDGRSIRWESFSNLGFQDFRARAGDDSLDSYEKIGIPTVIREGKDPEIFADLLSKLPSLSAPRKRVLDIGTGCCELAFLLVGHCEAHRHELVLCDSAEMLAEGPQDPAIQRVVGPFPQNTQEFIRTNRGTFDVVIAYGVMPVVYVDMNPYHFLDAAVSLLREGGELLLGDLPNVSKRSRFFSSRRGQAAHREFMGTETPPQAPVWELQEGKWDDGIVFSILQRYRNFGFETYLLPQRESLPMANRREDILIRRN